MAKLNTGIAMIYPIWGFLMLILALARLAPAAFKAGRRATFSPIAKFLRSLIWGGGAVAGAAQPLDKLVRDIGSVRRVERLSRFLMWMHPFAALTVAVHLCGWIFQFDSPMEHDYKLPFAGGDGIIQLFATGRFVVLLLFTCSVGTAYYPAWWTPLRFGFFHVLLTITCVVALALQQITCRWWYNNVWVVMVRTGMGIVHGDNRATIANNSVFSLAALVAFQLRWGMTASDFQLIVLPSVLICIASALVEQARDSELRATLEAKASKELETSVEAVLATICDAVVLLSSSFQLLRPSPHLAGLLLRSSSSAVLMTGGNFIDLLVESDRNAFLQSMSVPSTHAKMLHSHMRDANSSAVKVHLYHTKYLDLEGQPVHIIGIREDSEENRLQPPLQALPSSLSMQVVHEVWDRASGESPAASSFSGSSDPMPLVEGEQAMSLCVWVDASSTDLMMVKCTPEFTAWSGPSGLNEGLLSWVAPWDQSNFYEFFQRSLQYYIRKQSGHEVEGVEEPGSMLLQLKPPHLGRSFKAEVEIVEICDGSTEDSFSEPRILGCVSFKRTQSTQKCPSRNRRPGRASRHLDFNGVDGSYLAGLFAAAAESTMARPSTSVGGASSVGSATRVNL
ncbi:unnamed protein product [Polarella glacialis]|uniref:Uncharacterized protein n=1 Tax=Polarella glacialis TaxID=89957 RepID=A0A813IPS5_POLGL|nr:unnamed protein product [Polarella glacialis]CAE8654101.1 unnamed protein product [Polarella glacialis]CAE8715270.1 unnamed protein product [Polarella glacialis]